MANQPVAGTPRAEDDGRNHTGDVHANTNNTDSVQNDRGDHPEPPPERGVLCAGGCGKRLVRTWAAKPRCKLCRQKRKTNRRQMFDSVSTPAREARIHQLAQFYASLGAMVKKVAGKSAKDIDSTNYHIRSSAETMLEEITERLVNGLKMKGLATSCSELSADSDVTVPEGGMDAGLLLCGPCKGRLRLDPSSAQRVQTKRAA